MGKLQRIYHMILTLPTCTCAGSWRSTWRWQCRYCFFHLPMAVPAGDLVGVVLPYMWANNNFWFCRSSQLAIHVPNKSNKADTARQWRNCTRPDEKLIASELFRQLPTCIHVFEYYIEACSRCTIPINEIICKDRTGNRGTWSYGTRLQYYASIDLSIPQYRYTGTVYTGTSGGTGTCSVYEYPPGYRHQ